MSYLEVKDLRVSFTTDDGIVNAVNGVSLKVERGRTLGVVGESGSGKSVTSLAIMSLLNKRQAHITGEILLDGVDLNKLNDDESRKYRGRDMAMIFQDPMSSLHPFYSVGDQIAEAYMVHNEVDQKQALEHAIQMLDRVGIPEPAKRAKDYPHQFSGGMRQRAMIAMALCNNPSLLIADEPTTALDVTVQAQILALIEDVQKEFNSAVIIITHDLGVVAEAADEVAVMYGGRVVEQGTVHDIFYRPEMPYTVGLLASVPRLDQVTERLIPIAGQPPSMLNLPVGCAFAARCFAKDRVAGDRCFTELPELVQGAPGHLVRCHLPSQERIEIAKMRLSGEKA
jgi:peptide/nickel transport system ATP-binding protein